MALRTHNAYTKPYTLYIHHTHTSYSKHTPYTYSTHIVFSHIHTDHTLVSIFISVYVFFTFVCMCMYVGIHTVIHTRIHGPIHVFVYAHHTSWVCSL
ncbi:hypothetical protein EON63_04100 [archaeon]|nr:MAG: hypothetical protein EON63_04100 [archaeon]